MRGKSVATLGAGTVVAVLLGLVTSPPWMRDLQGLGSAPPQSSSQLLATPESWVPFTAYEVTRSTVTGNEVSAAKLYRNSQGSLRTEDSKGLFVRIQNLTEDTHYTFDARKDRWTRQPLNQRPKGFRWPQYERARVRPLPATWEGLDVYQFDAGDGLTFTIAPSLNNYMVEIKSERAKLRKTTRNIIVGEPDPSLFQPPQGAKIQSLSSPAGPLFAVPR